MIKADAAFANILANCATDGDLEFYVMQHALIVQHLVCHMAKEAHQTEAGIRTLYSTWADMAIKQLNDPRTLNIGTFH
jgi:hypothetical protein